jgi:hypothetical protein
MAAKRNNWTRAAALVAVAALTGAGLAGCGSMGRALGMSKQSPDEFAVVTKAPLVLPPDYELRPPKPGAKRPQELEPSEAAKQALFKNQFGQPAAPTTGEQALLTSAGADQADPEIRQQIAQDNQMLVRKSEGFANKLLFGNPNAVPAAVIDPEAERERLRKAATDGTDQSVDEDEKPTITKDSD